MIDDIGQLLDQLGLGKHISLFADNEIDLAALRYLSEDDLKELGLPMGPRKKLLAAIAELSPKKPGTTEHAAAAHEAERRQLTVMFVDLVQSTELAAQLDPEDLRDVIHRYQNAVAGEVARYEGHVAKFMGDGVLVYFGYPMAHEDEAERAVRAGLGVVEAVGRETAAGRRLRVRIGVATGQVVVGDLVGEGAAQEEAVIGETPNLAARLQEAGAPGQVVVAPATCELLAGLFEVAELGSKSLKGFAEPVTCWCVLGERAVESRFEAAHGGRLSRFVGRLQELSILDERWARAREGEGQVVFLTGEAGIGKSRLTRALMERLAGAPHTRLRYQCSPHHVNSALHPFVAQLERAADFEAGDGAEAKRAKLEALLSRATDDVGEMLPLFASLLMLPLGEEMARLEHEPQRRRQLTFEALLDQLSGLAARQTVLMVFEDAHWADPTSLELLEQIVDRVRQASVLILITSRTDLTPAWLGHSHVTMLTLNRLGRSQGAEIVADLTGGKVLPDVVLDQIVARTDGVPLFVEELTKAVLESGLLEYEGDRYVLKGELPPLAIPSTLQDSLMARLDRLAPVKEVAQIGAAIGREFPHRLLAEVSTLKGEQVIDALDQLVGSELLFRRGRAPDATYVFKHALVQDAAYGSLLRAKRQAMHQKIVAALEENYPERAKTEPEVLAHHYTEAGLAGSAVKYWQRAGQQALQGSANPEAVGHLRKGLTLLMTVPGSAERDRDELKLQTTLGPALMATRGYTAPEVGEAYRRAHELCRQVGETRELYAVLWALRLYHLGRAEHDTALAESEQLLGLAGRLSKSEYFLQARFALGLSSFYVGELQAAREHFDEGIRLYDPERHAALAFRYGGFDPGVSMLAHSAWTLWMLGDVERAAARAEQAQAVTRLQDNAYTLSRALYWDAVLRQFVGDWPSARARAEEAIAIANEHGFAYILAVGPILLGWALICQGQAAEGARQVRRGVDAYRAIGANIQLPHFLVPLAEAARALGRPEDGLEVLADAMARVENTGERYFEAELHRLKGELLLDSSPRDHGPAEVAFGKALAVARAQQARSLELRVATSFARLRQAQGKTAQARDLLAPIHGWFVEGIDTPDLKDATALLDELS